ncbi:hypothetical protein [Brevibacterium gallinarum]|uniref:MFS transporter n=1 Tax=Brevibacterium gallinarum TaxID=2762220 RepID=A0ABR8WXE8_9MICO|nr:hypothetical protein [Brevibacterium gallinarum]MBD8021356.1 hypothetical protein [Brevibacterium gallinarum]
MGAILYGVTDVPGTYTAQSWTAIVILLLAVGLSAYVDAPPLLIGLLCAVGIGQSVCIVARNLSLRERLHPDLHVVGFALLYSLSGVGYGISAGISAAALVFFSPQTTVIIGLGLSSPQAVSSVSFADSDKSTHKETTTSSRLQSPGPVTSL